MTQILGGYEGGVRLVLWSVGRVDEEVHHAAALGAGGAVLEELGGGFNRADLLGDGGGDPLIERAGRLLWSFARLAREYKRRRWLREFMPGLPQRQRLNLFASSAITVLLWSEFPKSLLSYSKHEQTIRTGGEEMYNFYEFFAGGGMVRAGLGSDWKCLFANDFDHKKASAYRTNWGDSRLKVADVGTLSSHDLPGTADLAWASFPCQDLSLAGGGAGLKGERSGTFRPFWKLMQGLIGEGRSPRLIVLENVCGALTSHGGKDFATLCGSLVDQGYLVGAVIVDAAYFVPQSRPRLFVIGVKDDLAIPKHLVNPSPTAPWHSAALLRAFSGLPTATKDRWLWWHMPLPVSRRETLSDVVDLSLDSPPWFSEVETKRLLDMMSPLNRAKVAKAMRYGKRVVGSVYKRTRPGADGTKSQRAEIRFDNISGCLRTPAGGSSRQLIAIIEGKDIKIRLISARETARLMGLADSYVLPENYNEAYHLTGDGVVVPAVSHLARQILEPLVRASRRQNVVAA